MSNHLSIYSKRCWIDGSLRPATIFVENGLITGISDERIEGAEDFGDHVIMPGIIDAHVHINEPGRTEWEGFITATQAAAAGGISTVIDMPLNASPVTTNAKAFHIKREAAENKLFINAGFYGGLIPSNIDSLEELVNEGVMGIKCFLVHSGIDEFPNVGEKEIDEAMPILAKYGIPLLAHCEIYDEDAIHDLDKFPGSYQAYLASRPKKWENDAVDLMIALCRKHQCPTHIVHVSSADALNSIEKAKAEGLPLTAETCAHYLYFHAGEIPDQQTIYKCAPPIREKENNEKLKDALASGVLDFITTDHSPAPPEIKQIESGNFQTGWGGIAGLQFLLPASWTALKETMTLEKFIPLLTEHPSNFLKLQARKGFLKKGFDADITVWNPEAQFVVKEEDILHRHKISPYINKTLSGTVAATYINGVAVFKNGLVEQNSPMGRVILHKTFHANRGLVL